MRSQPKQGKGTLKAPDLSETEQGSLARVRQRDYNQYRFEYVKGGTKPPETNNVILSDLEMLEHQKAKWKEAT